MKKMNKKGFTLIELLAVIAILAILMLMVTPNILSMFTSGRKQAFVTKVQTIWRAAEQGYMSEAISPTATPSSTYCSGVDNVTCSPISIVKDTDADYYVSMTDGYVNSIVAADSNYCVKTDKISFDLDTTVSGKNVVEGGSITCTTTGTGTDAVTTCDCE